VILWLRAGAIVAGIVLFALAEFRDAANEKKPYTSGRERYGTFYDDAAVLGLRLAGVGLVVLALITFVIGNHMPPR
jgi:branched-subunit amino acid permease